MKKPFKVPGNNQNTYICYKIPYEILRDTFASSIEFIAGNKSVVHHASYQILEVEDDVDIFSGPDYFVFDADTSKHTSNNVDEYSYVYFDCIITVCYNAKENCPYFPSNAKKFHQNFPDPAKATGNETEILNEFRKVRDLIKTYSKEFVSNI